MSCLRPDLDSRSGLTQLNPDPIRILIRNTGRRDGIVTEFCIQTNKKSRRIPIPKCRKNTVFRGKPKCQFSLEPSTHSNKCIFFGFVLNSDKNLLVQKGFFLHVFSKHKCRYSLKSSIQYISVAILMNLCCFQGVLNVSVGSVGFLGNIMAIVVLLSVSFEI